MCLRNRRVAFRRSGLFPPAEVASRGRPALPPPGPAGHTRRPAFARLAHWPWTRPPVRPVRSAAISAPKPTMPPECAKLAVTPAFGNLDAVGRTTLLHLG